MEIINKIGKYRSGSWYRRTANKVKIITVHHSAIPLDRYKKDETLLKAIQRTHEGHGWPGLSYHYVISGSGKIYQINQLEEVTWHDARNWDSIGVLVNGYFHPDVNDKPTKAQLESLEWLLDELCTKTPKIPADHDDVLAHRERSATACPGNNLYPYVVEYRENKGSVNWTNPEEDDMETSGSAKRLAELEKFVEKIKDELEEVEKEKDRYKRERNEARNDLSKQKKEHLKSESKLKEQLELIQKSQAEMGSQLTNNTKQYNDLSKELETTRTRLDDCGESLMDLEGELDLSKAYIENLEIKLSKKEKEVEKMAAKQAGVKTMSDHLQTTAKYSGSSVALATALIGIIATFVPAIDPIKGEMIAVSTFVVNMIMTYVIKSRS